MQFPDTDCILLFFLPCCKVKISHCEIVIVLLSIINDDQGEGDLENWCLEWHVKYCCKTWNNKRRSKQFSKIAENFQHEKFPRFVLFVALKLEFSGSTIHSTNSYWKSSRYDNDYDHTFLPELHDTLMISSIHFESF